ncbi:MAG: acetylxylan esterase, partial [Phycisphaerae bacterium]|nr:acetylxylan esterase [Phycisphaerae bacterium]
HFSPMDCYRHLMDNSPLALAYDGGDVKTWQTKLRKKLKTLMGYDRIVKAPRVDLNVRSLWKREHKLGTIEKIVFTAEPCADVCAYVCLPKNSTPPYTWFVCLQGHSTGMHNSIAVAADDETKTINIPGDRDFGLGCMERGVAAICIEQRGFGYRRWPGSTPEGYDPTNCKYSAMHALQLGRTLIAERVFDVDRTIDYLYTRDDVDRKRLGVMGNSGGGTTSVFSAALLPRVKLAMPSSYFCTFRDSIMAVPHCMCNFIPDMQNYAEMSDIMGLFAPRPVVVVAGKDDQIFPLSAVRKSFKKLKAIYTAAGAADRCQLVVGHEGHRFYAKPGWAKMLKQIEKI